MSEQKLVSDAPLCTCRPGSAIEFGACAVRAEMPALSDHQITTTLAMNQNGRLTPFSVIRRTWSWLIGQYTTCSTKRLRVAETISLGEKRFVAIVAVEGREFLIGGGTAGMSLLARLDATTTMSGGRESATRRVGGVR